MRDEGVVGYRREAVCGVLGYQRPVCLCYTTDCATVRASGWACGCFGLSILWEGIRYHIHRVIKTHFLGIGALACNFTVLVQILTHRCDRKSHGKGRRRGQLPREQANQSIQLTHLAEMISHAWEHLLTCTITIEGKPVST